MLAMSDTSEALVCIEMNLSVPRKERIWIDFDGSGYWQVVNYNRAPPLCSYCHKLGHLEDLCKKKKSKFDKDLLRREPIRRTGPIFRPVQ